MKSKTKAQQKRAGIGLLEVGLLALPFLALTPNFFVIPDLTYQGLATQELVFAITSATFALIGLVQIIRSQTNPFIVSREFLLMFAALASFILWQVISLSWAPAPYDGVRVAGIWLGFGVFFVTGLLKLQKHSAMWLYYSMTAVCLILAISLLYERALYGALMFGIFFNHGLTSELLVLLLPMQILSYLCNQKKSPVVVSFVVSGLSIIALLVGMRRGAILGLAFVLIAIAIALATRIIRLQSRQRLAIVLSLFVITVAVVGVRFRQEINYRFQGATQLNALEGGLTTRLRGWITAWEMGKRHALIGVGNAGYPSLYGTYRRYFVSNSGFNEVAETAGAEDYDEIRSPLTHNEYLQIFAELGIIGLLLFTAFWAQVVWRLWERRKAPNNQWIFGALLGLIAFGISSITSSFAFRFTPGAFMVPCVLAVGFAFDKTDHDALDRGRGSFSLPKIAGIICVVIVLIACVMFVGRTYNVYASQRLQGRIHLRQEPLDFAFYPNDPSGNERLQRRYEQVLDLDTENAGAHLGYGLLLFQMKKPAEAIPHIEYALKHGYSRPFTYVLLAFAHEQSGNLARASEILSDCAMSYPRSFFVRAAYAELLRKEGKLDQMREQQNAMYRLDERLAQSWELALRMKREEAVAEANRRSLIPPDKLWPTLASTLVGMRAYHYLK